MTFFLKIVDGDCTVTLFCCHVSSSSQKEVPLQELPLWPTDPTRYYMEHNYSDDAEIRHVDAPSAPGYSVACLFEKACFPVSPMLLATSSPAALQNGLCLPVTPAKGRRLRPLEDAAPDTATKAPRRSDDTTAVAAGAVVALPKLVAKGTVKATVSGGEEDAEDEVAEEADAENKGEAEGTEVCDEDDLFKTPPPPDE